MQNLVRKKIRGFKWDKDLERFYARTMENLIGKVGTIIGQSKNDVLVRFESYTNLDYYYPLAEALQHIVQEEPIVPELTEGVLMEVSHDGEDWWERKIIVKYKEHYISNILQTFKYARPIQPKKLTMAELETLVGGKFEIVNEE